MNLTQHTSSIWTISDFISRDECSSLIALSESLGYAQATVSLPQGAQMMKGIRNNSRLMYKDEILASRYWQSLKSYCPEELDNATAIGLNDQFRFYKYESAQRFKRHVDGRVKLSDSLESRITFMIYLNDDMVGGETIFDDVTIHPVTGTALCFIHELKHEGSPVTDGMKYVLRSDVMYHRNP